MSISSIVLVGPPEITHIAINAPTVIRAQVFDAQGTPKTPLVGLLNGVQLSLLMALYTLVVLVVLKVGVEPRLFKRSQYNPMLTIILLIALADALGLLGIVIAPPLSAACQILWSHLVSRRAVSGAAAQVSDLKERQALLWAAIKAMDEPPVPLVISSMERLTGLIEKAEPVLQAALPAEPSEPFPSPQQPPR